MSAPSQRPRLARRALLLAFGTALALLGCMPEPRQVADRGLGGTGLSGEPGDDRGIGGTGIVGTITGFGSIWVNGLKVEYGPATPVAIDGRPAAPDALAIGQVVRIAARGTGRNPTAERIEIAHAVVGPVEAVDLRGPSLRVLGQAVRPPAGAALPAPGMRVAVSGLRMADGTIAASRIAAAPDGAPALVRGRLTLAADGSARIGGLALVGLLGTPVPGEVLAVGLPSGGGLQVQTLTPEPATPFGRRYDRLSIEGLAVRDGDAARLPGSDIRLPATTVGQDGRIVVEATVDAAGALAVESVRAAGTALDAPSLPDVRVPDVSAPGGLGTATEGLSGGEAGGGAPGGSPGGIGDSPAGSAGGMPGGGDLPGGSGLPGGGELPRGGSLPGGSDLGGAVPDASGLLGR
ncbi:MAG TPA: DUF5666 domain-containing protein [Alphaproteobacteria bacterium]|nr:DUF5666 domain-containing protein [Alphaproteobacteria bacterium]